MYTSINGDLIVLSGLGDVNTCRSGRTRFSRGPRRGDMHNTVLVAPVAESVLVSTKDLELALESLNMAGPQRRH